MTLAGGVEAFVQKHERAVYYAVLVVAVAAVSCGGASMRRLGEETPPLLKAHWRTLSTALALGVGCAFQMRGLSPELRARLVERRTLLVLLGSGLALGAHFGFWVWSLDHTSLAHSLLLVTSHPLVVVVLMLITGPRPHWVETVGVGIGLCGAGVMLLDSASGDGNVTLVGDGAAFLGAVAIVGYLYAGRHLRAWMPLFIYAFPVTFIASLSLFLASAAFDGLVWGGLGARALFGWLAWDVRLPVILFIVAVPGLLGHTGINTTLRHVPALTVSMAITTEPVWGTLLGLAIGVAETPGKWTWVGGPINLFGTALTVYGSHLRAKRAAVDEACAAKEAAEEAARGDLPSPHEAEQANRPHVTSSTIGAPSSAASLLASSSSAALIDVASGLSSASLPPAAAHHRRWEFGEDDAENGEAGGAATSTSPRDPVVEFDIDVENEADEAEEVSLRRAPLSGDA